MKSPELSVTLKFRGVTIEGMTVEELRELRDLLDQIVGVKRVIERKYVPVAPYRPWYEPVVTYSPYWTITDTTSGTLRFDDGTLSQSLTISCNG